MILIAATNNKDKLVEIREILKDIKVSVVSMKEAGLDLDIEETGKTFEENALLKAKAVHSITGGYVMADDSGLTIKALDGAPGIYSARFAGEDAGYDIKIKRIWEMLEESGSDDRSASFVCAVAVVRPDGSHFVVRGECHGQIHDKIEGENGFGYDPIFYIPEYGMTTASMSPELKNSISHRGKALRKAFNNLKEEINTSEGK